LRPPQSRMDILTGAEIDTLVNGSKIASKYNQVIDSQSAYEILTAKLNDASQREAQEKQQEVEEKKTKETTTTKKDKGFFDDPTVKSMTRTAGNTIVRTLLGVLGLGGRSRSRKSLF